MATIYADPEIPTSEPLAGRRRREACRRALEACGWERLAPLAQHMVPKARTRSVDRSTLRVAVAPGAG